MDLLSADGTIGMKIFLHEYGTRFVCGFFFTPRVLFKVGRHKFQATQLPKFQWVNLDCRNSGSQYVSQTSFGMRFWHSSNDKDVNTSSILENVCLCICSFMGIM